MFDKSYSGDAAIAASQSFKEREYWLEKLSGEWVKSCFPYDNTGHQESGEKSGDKHRLQVPFSGELFSRLTWISNQSDIRLLTVLVGGLLVLINKYTDTRDIIVGMPIYKQEAEGSYINTVLALRCLLQEEMTFKELLYRVKQTIEEAIKHQNYPIKTLLYDLKLTFSQKDFPLFDIILMLKNIQDPAYVHHIPANMEFIFFRTPQCLELVVQYNPFLYEKETVERIVNHFCHLLNTVIFNVDLSLAGIDILPEGEKKKLLEEFNRPWEGIKDHADKTIHGLFEEQVEKTPDQMALVFIRQEQKPELLTYRQLNEKARRLARILKEKGITSEHIAALLIESSIDMAVAVLAVLKAGGLYLPIDKEAPEVKKTFILKDSGARLVLTGAASDTTLFPGLLNIEQLNVSVESLYTHYTQQPEETSSTRAEFQGKPSDPAYIIYTSGSTGRPKGVIIQHNQAVNTLVCRKEEYHLTPGHTALQLFSYAFDGFITSFFTPVISGARVILLCRDTIQDISKIVEVITAFKVTHFISVPVLFQAILTNITASEAASLQVVTLAGDKVHPRLVEMAAAKNKNLEIVNEYGVTEAAVMSTIYRHQERDGRVKIGHPIGNTSIYITKSSDHRYLAPIGVFGEMCIAGAGVARGYMNNPELTADKFEHDLWDYRDYHDKKKKLPVEGTRGLAPLSKKSPGKNYNKLLPITPLTHYPIYHTGDLARWLPDGNIEFSGRMDFQVKVRGFRIELGEIERHLLTHHLIKETIVTASENDEGDKYLCAYIVSTRQLSVSELREYLVDRLPEYMIPAYFVFLEQMPLSPSGKVDRKQLPAPDTALSTKEYIPPRNRLEQKLVEIWAGVLGCSHDAIGIDTDFFELGGHSLSATLMSNRIYKDLNVKVPMVEIFKAPRIRNLAGYISSAKEGTFISIQPVEKKEFYPLSSAQKRMFLLHQIKANDVSDNTPEVMVVEGNLNKKFLEEVLKRLIKRHEALRSSFEFIGEELIQRVHDDVLFEIENYECLPQESEKIIGDFIRPFDLGKAPLLRVGLVIIPGEKKLLMYDIHHIARDAVSTEIFRKEFFYLYEGVKLPPLRLQYKDFTIWQNEMLASGIIEKQENYWLEVFSGEIPKLNMPTDYPRPANQSFAGETIESRLNNHLTQKINEIALESGTTLSVVILTIYNILLSKYSGQEDIVVGIPIAGRTHADLENIVGLFLNTLAVRNYPVGEKTFLEFLGAVKSNMLDAYENQEYQFDALVNRLGLKPDPGRNPLFDTMLVVQTEDNVPLANLSKEKEKGAKEIRNLSFKPHNYLKKATQFEIVLFVWEEGDVLDLVISYCIKIFKRETLERFLRHFEEIANCVVHNKHLRLKDLEITEDFADAGSNLLKEAKNKLEF